MGNLELGPIDKRGNFAMRNLVSFSDTVKYERAALAHFGGVWFGNT